MLTHLKLKARKLIRDEVKRGIRESQMLDTLHEQIQKDIKDTGLAAKGSEKPVTARSFGDNIIKQMAKALKEDDSELALIIAKKLAAQKRCDNAAHLRTAAVLRKMLLDKKDDGRNKESIKALFTLHQINEMGGDQLLDVAQFRFPVMQAASLTQQYVRRRRMKQIGQVPDRWLTYSKRAGEEFAQAVGIRCPETQYDLPFDRIECQADTVIKPMRSSKAIGAYIIHSADRIGSLHSRTILNSWEELRSDVRALLAEGAIAEDCFEQQQCIYADEKAKLPAHDLKFYVFYGEVGAVLEVARYPRFAYWWWSAEGELIDTGDTTPEEVKPIGATSDMMETAKHLSLQIPAPFLRLDFLRSEDAMYFDEFCTVSGEDGAVKLERQFPKYDALFGNLYLKAEMRIVNDMLEGKKFDKLNEFNRRYTALYQK